MSHQFLLHAQRRSHVIKVESDKCGESRTSQDWGHQSKPRGGAPHAFLPKLSAGEANEEDEFAEETRQDLVLEAAAGRFHPSRRLKWHYRSEHDSLIAFSNREFYQNDLTVFPSPFYDHPEYGVKLVQANGALVRHSRGS
jgi:hypothetical protein